MGNKSVVTIRFQVAGAEAELYRKIQEEKRKAGLSASEYVKRTLSEYFIDEEKREKTDMAIRGIREECQGMMGRVEEAIRCGIQEHDAALIGILGKIKALPAEPEKSNKEESARLPEESNNIPEGALDFLEKFS